MTSQMFLGVVGAIVPWNFPLMLLTWKVNIYLLIAYSGIFHHLGYNTEDVLTYFCTYIL